MQITHVSGYECAQINIHTVPNVYFYELVLPCNREVVGSNLNNTPSCTDFLQSSQVNDAFKRDDLFLACHPFDKNRWTSEAIIMQV